MKEMSSCKRQLRTWTISTQKTKRWRWNLRWRMGYYVQAVVEWATAFCKERNWRASYARPYESVDIFSYGTANLPNKNV